MVFAVITELRWFAYMGGYHKSLFRTVCFMYYERGLNMASECQYLWQIAGPALTYLHRPI